MDRVFFEGIRCFATRQEVPLAPLTILVGENSSGKSTALALMRIAWDIGNFPAHPLNFNEEPFLLGAYEQVRSSFLGRRRPDSFIIGISTKAGSVIGQVRRYMGVPRLHEQSIALPGYRLHIQYRRNGNVGSIGVERGSEWDADYEDFNDFILYSPHAVDVELVRLNSRLGSRPYAFAPIRTRPRRTYDPIKSNVNPEGGHIPLILASSTLRKSKGWRNLVSTLEAFGLHSGLFSKVSVRQLGKSESDPFQIQIHFSKRDVNLIDVGYGVSQILPIVVDCLRGGRGGTYLLQQPEVHLHPRAQAELGSFLGVLAKQQNKRFVIETHSDYLVDRIRMDIRDKKGITPDDVALLYFERKNGEATIHRLDLDDQGNIINAPPGYRSFFLEEERRFLGGG